MSTAGIEGNEHSQSGSISSDGRFVAFDSGSTTLVPGDANGRSDIFVRDRQTSDFAVLCEPGAVGVMSCPCTNPPSDNDRGCDNSSSTGGASLSATGHASLSQDRLVCTTSGENPAALSVLMQRNSAIPGGVVYGQGVRCLGGPIIRPLFTKAAVGGSITAPEYAAGDPAVSVQTAAKGDVILPGQARWYLVYYRDPVVLGGCPSTSTFNATQTGRVSWSP